MMPFLVVQGARFGDLVQSKRLLLTLKERGEVHLGIDRSLVPLARLLYPRVEIHGLRLHTKPEPQALKENMESLALWRDIDFKAVYNCNFSPLTTALCRVFEPEKVIGYRPGPNEIVRSPWVRTGFRLSEKRRFTPLNLTDFWAHFVSEPMPADKVNPLPVPGRQGLGVVLAGRESRRSLPAPLLAEIVFCLFNMLGGPRVRLFGTKTEQAAAHKLLRQLPPKIHPHIENLTGKTDWPGLFEAISGLDMLLTPDTGTMHLGAHLGVPVIAFFLASAFCHETGPYGDGHQVWQAASACAPCLESAPCQENMACLKAFQSRNFMPALKASLESKEMAEVPLPDDLQLWQGELDNLGVSFRLRAGTDDCARQRGLLRERLLNMAAFPNTNFSDNAMACVPDFAVLSWLNQDSDWMLPPERYC